MDSITSAAGLSWKARMQPATADEHTQMQRIAAGDEDALRDLYAACGQRLYAYALRLTSDPALAEEALQETLIAVWQGAGRYRGEGRVIAWLLRITHNQALNLLRERPAGPLDDESRPELPAPGPAPDLSAEMRDRGRIVREGLTRLSIDHRAALELVFYQGLSLGEAAAVLDCPLGTVKSRLSYAKTWLRGWLVKEGLGAEEVE